MKHVLTFLLAACSGITSAQSELIPPDAFGDQHNTATGWIPNVGQLLGTDMVPTNEVIAYTDGYGMRIWLMDKSTFRLSRTVTDTIPGTNDTTFCVSVAAAGNARSLPPTPYRELPGRANFYYPHTGTNAEEVTCYHREVYPDVWPDISMHFYTSRGGPKLAFVCQPGSDPSEILLAFDGQDSLKVDVQGYLKMYIRGKWLVLSQAIAYQVGTFGNPDAIVPLGWVPVYEEEEGTGKVHFVFQDYDQTKPLVLQIGAPPMPAADVEAPRNMLWSTYAGSDKADEFMATDVDANGDVYVTGYTYQANFPVNTGFQVFSADNANFAGSEDVVTMKFRASDKRIMWATYQGGGSAQTGASDEWRGLDKAYDLVAYKGGNTDLEYVFVTGSTMSPDYPTYRRANTPFANADETAFTGNPSAGVQAAFILAYTEERGRLDWSTTIGTNGGLWWADGLGVDVLDDGRLIWVGRTSGSMDGGPMPGFPYHTPNGAYLKQNGGGFIAAFDEDYQYEWTTLFGGQGSISGVFDVKLDDPAAGYAYLTGVTMNTGHDVFPFPDPQAFYQPSFGGGTTDAYFAIFELGSYLPKFSTYWGGTGDDRGIALEVESIDGSTFSRAWVGGLSKSTDLTSAQLPFAGNMPGTALHQTSNAGEADGFLLRFDSGRLNYGTLFGGDGHDAILDIDKGLASTGELDPPQLYVVGETRSDADIEVVDNGLLYRQGQLGSSQGAVDRDGFLLVIDSEIATPTWSTYIGGFNSDKCWGVAAAPDELFVVGGTVSTQSTFPLKEFDLNAPEDWYDGNLLNNVGSGGSGFYSFSDNSFWNPFGETFVVETMPGTSFDAFITSFGVSPTVSVRDLDYGTVLRPVLIDPGGIWSVAIPNGAVAARVHDSQGKLVFERKVPGSQGLFQVDLRSMASGIYLINCLAEDGAVVSAKVYRP